MVVVFQGHRNAIKNCFSPILQLSSFLATFCSIIFARLMNVSSRSLLTDSKMKTNYFSQMNDSFTVIYMCFDKDKIKNSFMSHLSFWFSSKLILN